MKARVNDPVTHYAQQVVKGKVLACKWVKLACERHLEDLRTGEARGFHFDVEAANRAIKFFRFLKHSKGEWAGQAFLLELWQAFIVGCLFGWKRTDGLRRFRHALVETARKSGKTTLMAGIGLYLLVADDEPGAEIYTAATKRDQARLTHSEATRMVRKSPALRRRIRIFKDNLSIEETASKYEPLGADADTTDGLNPHGCLIDELHAHKTRDMVDVLETGMGARRQPLMFEITTAGLEQESIWREHHDYSQGVLQGTVQDDTWFCYIATLDEGDDWQDEKVWPKANPNLGISVKMDDLRRQCEKARRIPAAQNAFRRLRMNVPTQQVSRWIDLDLWDENWPPDHPPPNLQEAFYKGRTCYGGLDLGAVDDLSAWVMVFDCPYDPEAVDVIARFWCPESKLYDTQNRYHDQYQVWARQGWLGTTEGKAVDYGAIRLQILKDAGYFLIEDMAIDRLFQAHQLAMELADEEVKVIGMGQGFISMAAPTKELHRLLLREKIHHGGHPVLRFMAEGVAVKGDPAGNMKVDKAESHCKVDGIVALIMALDRRSRREEAVEWGVAG